MAGCVQNTPEVLQQIEVLPVLCFCRADSQSKHVGFLPSGLLAREGELRGINAGFAFQFGVKLSRFWTAWHRHALCESFLYKLRVILA